MTKQNWLNSSFVGKLLEVETWVMFLRAPLNVAKMTLLKSLAAIISALALGNIVMILALINCGRAAVNCGRQVRRFYSMHFELD